MIEKGALSDNILPSSSKEVQEKEDDLTLKGIPSRHNQPLTTSDIREKENMHNQSQSIREISKEAIQPKQNLSFATKNQGIGNPLNNDWGKVSNFRTKSPWNKVSANEKGNPSKVIGNHSCMMKKLSKEESSKSRICHLQQKCKE